MEFKTFWCGRCNRNKPMGEFVRRKGGSAICRSCENSRLQAMANVRKHREALRKSA